MPVVLWTDALIYLLVAGLGLFAWYAHRQPHLREPWRRVFLSRMGMATLVVLLAYVVVGLLDSVHYRPALEGGNDDERYYASEMHSVLDWLATPLRENVEKTYSAPLATRLYTKETVERPDGTIDRVYPRLEHGGTHLADPEQEWAADIAWTAAVGAGKGLIVAIALTGLMVGILAVRRRVGAHEMLARVLGGRTEVPWRTAIVTASVLIVLCVVVIDLAVKYHVFGTDKVGQDVFYTAVKSIRTGLVIGTLTTLIMLPFAILMGVMAGYFRGWVDDIIQYLYTTISSIPGVLLIAAAILMIQVYIANHPQLFETTAERADLRLLFLCIILGITSWTSLCRLLRGETLKLSEMDYVQAATGLGVGHFTILGRHVVPNVMHIVLIQVVLDFSNLVLAEAVLAYVGVGVDPTTASWGNMINSARLELAREPIVWWSLAAAFLFMFVLVLSANLFSDAVRDAFDPRLRRGTQ